MEKNTESALNVGGVCRVEYLPPHYVLFVNVPGNDELLRKRGYYKSVRGPYCKVFTDYAGCVSEYLTLQRLGLVTILVKR